MHADPLIDYYDRRASDYEAIYRKPERQSDLLRLEAALVEFGRGHDVLELACGTGYWTARLARTARTVTGIDLAPAVLEEAARKDLPPARIRFRTGDAFRLEEISGSFDAVAAAFLWSHIPRRQIAVFLDGLTRRFPDGVPLFLIDNRYVEGSSTPITRRDERGDTWQRRRLEDGTTVDIVKNFPTPDELTALTRLQVSDVDVVLLEHYWILTGRTNPVPPPANPDDPAADRNDASNRRFL